MADGHGGARTPAHPAPVSGPGHYSKRTDGGPAQVLSAAPDQAYGEQKAQLDAQRAVPMGGTAPMPSAGPLSAGPPSGGGGGTDPVPLSAPSQRPNEPITHGVDIGPGAGSEAVTLPTSPAQQPGTGAIANMLRSISATDTTGSLGQLYQAALTRGV